MVLAVPLYARHFPESGKDSTDFYGWWIRIDRDTDRASALVVALVSRHRRVHLQRCCKGEQPIDHTFHIPAALQSQAQGRGSDH
jgi:hypothetical protein